MPKQKVSKLHDTAKRNKRNMTTENITEMNKEVKTLVTQSNIEI
jgi:hypothetical protein